MALVMAVPRVKPGLRLKILILGLTILFPIQIFRLSVFVFNFYGQQMIWSTDQHVYPEFARNFPFYARRIMLRVDAQMIPILIWAGLFYYYKWHRVFMDRIRSRFEPETERTKSD